MHLNIATKVKNAQKGESPALLQASWEVDWRWLSPVQAYLRASWTRETISAFFWWPPSHEQRKDGPEQWYAVASPPSPSAVVSAIRLPAANSLLSCDLLFPVCHLRNQMTRAVRTVCKWRAELWEIDRDHLLQESREQVSWQPFLFFSGLFLTKSILTA